jgi:hypothetical protein
MDIYETPILWSLEINGKLTCPNGQPCIINARNLWVRQGELEIGTKDDPFNSTAIIKLHGNNTNNYWAFTPQIDSGNKNLVVTGTANIYGMPRTHKAFLLETAYKFNDTIRVQQDLDWVAGDEIALVTSTLDIFESEHHVIKSYDPTSGLVELEDDVGFYHFGDSKSTGDKYNGIDMRSSVLLLTRNVRIIPSEEYSYSL